MLAGSSKPCLILCEQLSPFGIEFRKTNWSWALRRQTDNQNQYSVNGLLLQLLNARKQFWKRYYPRVECGKQPSQPSSPHHTFIDNRPGLSISETSSKAACPFACQIYRNGQRGQPSKVRSAQAQLWDFALPCSLYAVASDARWARVREAACDTVKAHSAFSPDSLEPTSREWRAAKTSAERALPPRPARCPRPSPRPAWCHTGHPVAAACF